jgi:hypothetical protein
MELRFCDVEEWLAQSDDQYPCDIPPYVVQDSAGFAVRIKPFVSLCRNLIVIGGDWLPVRANGLALLEQMVHTPGIYLGKSKNLGFTENSCYSKIETIREIAADTLLVGGDSNYYHWLIDYLPRLLLARKYADIGAHLIIVNSNLLPFQLDSLRILGFDDSQLLQVGENEAIRSRTTLVPSLLASTTVPHPALPGLLKEAFPCRRSFASGRIYLSRQEAASRQLTNEVELIKLLEKYGFRKHVPGTLSFQEQIDLCSGAEALVAVHGAAMANIVFCPETTRIFEIFSPHHQVTSMYMLSRVCKRPHRFVPAKNVTFGRNGNALLGSWEVDLGSLDSALKAEFG